MQLDCQKMYIYFHFQTDPNGRFCRTAYANKYTKLTLVGYTSGGNHGGVTDGSGICARSFAKNCNHKKEKILLIWCWGLGLILFFCKLYIYIFYIYEIAYESSPISSRILRGNFAQKKNENPCLPRTWSCCHHRPSLLGSLARPYCAVVLRTCCRG